MFDQADFLHGHTYYKMNGSDYWSECSVGPTMGGANHEVSTTSGKNLISELKVSTLSCAPDSRIRN